MAVYTDLNLRMTVHPVTGDIAKLTDADAVTKSVKHLLMTGVFERPFEPGIGSRITQLLFEPMDTVTERLLVNEIKQVLDKYEPRIQVVSITMTARPDEYSFQTSIEYKILNIPSTQRVSVVLARIR